MQAAVKMGNPEKDGSNAGSALRKSSFRERCMQEYRFGSGPKNVIQAV